MGHTCPVHADKYNCVKHFTHPLDCVKGSKVKYLNFTITLFLKENLHANIETIYMRHIKRDFKGKVGTI